MGDMIVRDARTDDLETIVDFNINLAIDSNDELPEREILRRGVLRALERPELCRYFMAELEGELVGQTMITYEWTDWRDGTIWWLQSVYVAPAHRGQGVFSRIYQHIRDQARADPEARCIRLYALASNEPARHAYLRCGMKQGGYVVYEGAL
jgi:GNAT superfamily N-acetyltransferase